MRHTPGRPEDRDAPPVCRNRSGTTLGVPPWCRATTPSASFVRLTVLTYAFFLTIMTNIRKQGERFKGALAPVDLVPRFAVRLQYDRPRPVGPKHPDTPGVEP